MCFSRVCLVDPSGHFLSVWPTYSDLSTSIKLLRSINHIIHPSVMIDTDVLKSLGGYKSAPRAQDYDLWNEMLLLNIPISYVDDVLSSYLSSGNMKSFTADYSSATVCSYLFA